LQKEIDTYLIPCGSSLQDIVEKLGIEDALEIEGREILLFVVGTGRTPGLERMVSYLSERFKVPISVVLYEVFELPDGQQILVRRLTEYDFSKTFRIQSQSTSIEEVCKLAEDQGIGREFKVLLDAAQQHSLYPRVYKQSIMYTPPKLSYSLLKNESK
ncbi:MAG TPA: hypothetical protein VHT73_19445, partial [Thermodesulfobacteriota bacterium]|nr:hypothetical protein [Thermodesulfobacteriota bacterium]